MRFALIQKALTMVKSSQREVVIPLEDPLNLSKCSFKSSKNTGNSVYSQTLSNSGLPAPLRLRPSVYYKNPYALQLSEEQQKDGGIPPEMVHLSIGIAG